MIRGMRRPSQGGRAEVVREWVRERFALGHDAVIVVAELRCQVPGCPPIETVATFWDTEGERYALRVFKPLDEVVDDDLPPRWYMPALRDLGEAECSCC